MRQPALLIDVDGVLNPYDTPDDSVPAGYGVHRMIPTDWDPARPLRVFLNRSHGRMLLALADVVELVWCTTWDEDANTMIGPRIGLPRLPVVPLGPRPTVPGRRLWKVQGVVEWAGERPLAWLDDDFGVLDHAWAHERTVEGAPTLLVDVDPSVGLVQEQLDTVVAWAERLAT